MKTKKATAKDVAQLAGVSQSAVSMILNNKSDVSFAPQTIERVFSAARQLNYQTKRQQSVALNNNDRLIAVIVPTLANPYYSTLVQSLDNAAATKGFGILVCNTYRDQKIEARYIDLFASSNVQGIIFASMPYHKEKAKALSLSTPIVVVSDKNESVDLDTVELNSTEAGEIMAQHLLELGHKTMVFVTTPLDNISMPRIRRLEGLRQTIRSAGAKLVVQEPTKKLMSNKYDLDLEHAVGYALAQMYIDDASITAFVGVNDMVAYGILDALEEANIRVPEDRSVCGFDNIFPSKFNRVSLTTIESFLTEKGRDAFELLHRKMPNQEQEGQSGIFRIEYKPTLVARNSTGPARL